MNPLVIALVTVDDLFHFHNSNLVAAFNPVSVEPLTQIDHHFTYEILWSKFPNCINVQSQIPSFFPS